MKAIILLSHGSKAASSQAEVANLTKQIARDGKFDHAACAYLGSAEPHFLEVVRQFAAQGVTDVTVVLHFLNTGNHVTDDVPRLLREALGEYPGVHFHWTVPLGLHPDMSRLCLDLIQNAQPFRGDFHG